MCVKYSITLDRSDERISALSDRMEKNFPGRYSVGEIWPGTAAPSIVRHEDRITAVPATFGVPAFGNGKLLINARSETASLKKTFRENLRTHRILLPSTGFYERDREQKNKMVFFVPEDGKTVYLCGLYFIMDGKIRFVILTREANEVVSEFHDRMPVIVDETQVRPWLTDLSAAEQLLAAPAPQLIHIG